MSSQAVDWPLKIRGVCPPLHTATQSPTSVFEGTSARYPLSVRAILLPYAIVLYCFFSGLSIAAASWNTWRNVAPLNNHGCSSKETLFRSGLGISFFLQSS